MTSTARKLLDEALSLPPNDRRRLAEALLDSVPLLEVDTQQAWVDEATRRADEVESGTGELRDLREALDGLRADLQRG